MIVFNDKLFFSHRQNLEVYMTQVYIWVHSCCILLFCHSSCFRFCCQISFHRRQGLHSFLSIRCLYCDCYTVHDMYILFYASQTICDLVGSAQVLCVPSIALVFELNSQFSNFRSIAFPEYFIAKLYSRCCCCKNVLISY